MSAAGCRRIFSLRLRRCVVHSMTRFVPALLEFKWMYEASYACNFSLMGAGISRNQWKWIDGCRITNSTQLSWNHVDYHLTCQSWCTCSRIEDQPSVSGSRKDSDQRIYFYHGVVVHSDRSRTSVVKLPLRLWAVAMQVLGSGPRWFLVAQLSGTDYL